MTDAIGITTGSMVNVWAEEVGAAGSYYAQIIKLADGTAEGHQTVPAGSDYGLAVDVRRFTSGSLFTTGCLDRLTSACIDRITAGSLDRIGAITVVDLITTGSLQRVGAISAVDSITTGSLQRVGAITAVDAITTGSLQRVAAISAVDSLTAIAAGETHIGNMSGTGVTVPITLTVTNGAYTAQDVVGGLITMASAVRASGKMAYLDSLTLGGQTSAIAFELWLFNADLATPLADNEAFALVAADLPKVLGIIPVPTNTQYQGGAGGVYFASIRGIGELATSAATTLYAYLKHTTTTSPGTTSLFLRANYSFLS